MVYNRNGEMTETQGVFSDQDGTVLTEYDALKHAVRAVVTDAAGKEYPVKEILGANAMYNVVRMQVACGKDKLTCLHQAAAPQPPHSATFIFCPMPRPARMLPVQRRQ